MKRKTRFLCHTLSYKTVTVVLFVFVLEGIVPASSYPASNATIIEERFVHQYSPFQLSLNYPEIGHFCGGSIITDTAALTVIFCLKDKTITDIFLRCGIVDLQDSRKLGAYGKEAFFHEDYDGINNIVALVLVEGKFPIDGRKVASIQIATSAPVAGSLVTLIGWTTYAEDTGENSEMLQSLDIPIVGHSNCAANFGDYQHSVVTPGTICAGPNVDGKGYCFGDSGSPVVNKGGQLVGAVSWHEEQCLNSDLPGTFCDFFYYKSWIDERLNKEVKRNTRGCTSRVLVFRSVLLTVVLATCLLS